MSNLFKTIGTAFVLLLAAGFLAGCDSGTGTRSTTRSVVRNDQDGAQPVPAPAEPEVEAKLIRAGVGLDEQSSQYKGLLKFKELVESASNGRLKVELFTDLRPDSGIEMSYALQAGTLDMACLPSTSLVRLDKRWVVFDLPFLFKDEEEADRVLDGTLGKEYLDSLLAHDLVGMAFWENGFSQVTNGVRVVQSPSDLKGLKIGTTEKPIHQATLKALGAKPMPISSDQRFAALYQKLIDGQESPSVASIQWKYYEAQRYITLTNHLYSPFVFLYSRRLWDTLAPEDQLVLSEAAWNAGKHQRQINREAASEALASLSKAGMVVTDPGLARHEAFVKATAGVAKQFEADFGADKLQAIRDEIAGKNH